MLQRQVYRSLAYAAQLRRQQHGHINCTQLLLRQQYSDDSSSGSDHPLLKRLKSNIFGKEPSNEGSGSGSSKGSGSSSGDEGALVPSGPELKHRKVFMVELSRKPLFPGVYTPVLVHKNERLIKEVLEQKKQGAQAYVGAFLRKPDAVIAAEKAKRAAAASGRGEDGGSSSSSGALGAAGAGVEGEVEDPAAHLYEIGTFAQVHTILGGDTTDSAQLLLLGHRRLKREATLSSDPLRCAVSHCREPSYDRDDDITKATSMEIVNTMKDLLQMNPLYGEQFRTLMSLTGSIDLNDLSRLVDAAASLTSADEATLQGILETLAVPQRAQLVLELLKKEVELCRLQADIREQVESKILKEQRRMILMEQLKSIKRELGLEKDDKSALISRFQDKWEPKKAAAPEDVRRVVQDELDKLSGLELVSPEFNVTRNYLEWLTGLPWGVYSSEVFDIDHARTVLDEDHYGLDDVKQRILEFVAVSRLRGSAQGKILCLVGPPGVGKTSIGRSIARTLGRKYYRFSVGGLYDVAEIKGHRRTYVGAMPGKMVQCLKATQTSNPLVLIDEIDKLGRGHTGDPASALLELLDPEQNSGFLDHYLDVPIDLSKVLFVCTANVLDTIPGPLLDRMEVIRLSGYTADEKTAIARRYLEGQCRGEAGVPEGAVGLRDEALDLLIQEYCREAGVRNLRKHLEKVYRKAALKLVKGGARLVGGDPAPGTPDTTTTTTSSSSSSSTAAGAEPSSSTPSSGEGDTDTSHTPSSSSSDSSDGSSDSSSSDPAPGSPTTPPTTSSSSSQPRVEYSGDPIEIGPGELKDYVGIPPFAKDRFYDTTPPGVVMGLAWTAMGGATLYVEAAPVVEGEGKGGLVTTGQLGEVMRESATIGHTYARRYLYSLAPGNKYLENTSIHVHVPAGATPKDGPSAGCTIITALLSLALGRPVLPDAAMTGEVTLTGVVLPIGGVKEKLLAARRSGVKTVIFPEANRRDYEEVSADLKEGMTPHFVTHYDQIFDLVLGGKEGLNSSSSDSSSSSSGSSSSSSGSSSSSSSSSSGSSSITK